MLNVLGGIGTEGGGTVFHQVVCIESVADFIAMDFEVSQNDYSVIDFCVWELMFRRGWPESANTWEPLEHLNLCPDVVEVYEQRYGFNLFTDISWTIYIYIYHSP